MSFSADIFGDYSYNATFSPGATAPDLNGLELLQADDFAQNELKTHWQLSLLVHCCYHHAQTVEVLAAKIDMELIEDIRVRSQRALIFRDKEALIIAFQGSCSVEDNLLNLRFFGKTLADGETIAHRGFVRAHSFLSEQVDSALKKHCLPVKYVCGHSLGGALAILEGRKHIKAETITFAAPRVFKFRPQACELERRLTRIENGRDLVPHLPPRIFGFRTQGKIVKLRLAQNKGGLPFFLGDHAPVNYTRGLMQLIIN